MNGVRKSIATINTKDYEALLVRRANVKEKYHVNDEEIYIAGLESLEKLEK